ncbi:MAG: 2Fe-2S iron-sulfur cluster-binding protein [Massilia sp.]
MKLIFILKDGSRAEVEAKAGATAMETAIRNNIRGIDGECGGCCSCATCHVYVEPVRALLLPPPDEVERELLEGVAAERRPTSRLSCQIVLSEELDGLILQVPAAQS